MSEFISFLWWAEQKHYSYWLTGINDRKKHGDNENAVALEPAKGDKHEYSNPHKLEVKGEGRKKGYGAKKRFDTAYSTLQIKKDSSTTPKEMALHYRNLLILRAIREGSLRNTEDISLRCLSFKANLNTMNLGKK